MNKQMVKDTAILFCITLVAGLLLGGVYQLTKKPIEQAEIDKKMSAYETVFHDAATFEAYGDFDGEAAQSILNEAGLEKSSIDEVNLAFDSQGEFMGYVVVATNNEAYSGQLQLVVGIQKDGTVNGISYLSLVETVGLGMEAAKPFFMDQFAGKKVEQFSYSKTGATMEHEIDALSGATRTTNAVTNAVNASLVYVNALQEQEAGGEGNE